MGLQLVQLLNPIRMTIAGTFNPMGAYNGATNYAVGDQVDYNGSSYIMYVDAGAGTLPTNTTYWGLIAEKGDTGATGATGATGSAGADGADGNTVLSGVIDPTTEGVNGDFYINTANDTIFGPKTAGVWGSATSLVGPTGAAGSNGTNGTDGVGVPAGGTAGQVLSKIDGTDYNTQWVADAGGIADPGSNGILARTALNTTSARTITGTANQVTVTNGDGVSGNPTLSLPQDIHTGASPTFGRVIVSGINAVPISIVSTAASGSGSGAGITAISSDGAALASGDRLGFLLFGGNYDNTNTSNTCGIITYANEAWTSTAKGSMLELAITKIGSATRVTGLRVGADGYSGTQFYGTAYPSADSTYTLGTSALYWSKTYTDRLYLNSTVYLDGTTTGIAEVAGAISGSTSLLNAGNFTYNGGGSFINYNGGTAFNQRQSGMYIAIANSFAGTRSNRLSGFDFTVLNSVSQTASALYGAFGTIIANAASSVITAGAGFSSQLSLQNQASMSIGSYFGVQPQAITSNLAGANTMTITSYGGISIPAQAAVTNLTITTQYGLLIGNLTGATTNYAIYTGTGLVRFGDVMLPVQATTAGAPAYVKGGIYFDTTLNKLRVGGATAWETCTSV